MSFLMNRLSILALLLMTASVGADEAQQHSHSGEESANAAVQVFIDEKTGELRAPTEEEKSEMAEQFRRRFIDQVEDKPIVRNADGSLSKELGTRHRMYTVARIAADGELETRCLTQDLAVDFLNDEKMHASPDEASE
ncbi:MAG: hypothetical protein KJO35_02100 [Gammaproteobacteria bacterium]|nr:hypothetical protein [Gammaproteobacteria bacterium]